MFSVTVYLFKIGVTCNDANLTDAASFKFEGLFYEFKHFFIIKFHTTTSETTFQNVLTVYLAISKEAHVIQHNQSSLEKSRCRFHPRRKGKMSEADRPKRFD